MTHRQRLQRILSCERGFIHKKLLGGFTGAVGAVLSGGNPITGAFAGFAAGGSAPRPGDVVPVPGFGGGVSRFLPGGSTGYEVVPSQFGGIAQGPSARGLTEVSASAFAQGLNGAQGGKRKQRRMNVANPKALRRAIRREAGFVNLARRALKGTKWKIVSQGSGRARGPKVIVESGPGSVVTR